MRRSKILLLLTAILFCTTCIAQSPFKRLPKPYTQGAVHSNAIGDVVAPAATLNAFRFTGPIAGYMYPQNQVVTGIGYGYQKLHWDDAIQRYKTDFSINAVAYAGGNVEPDLKNPNSIMSLGISAGFANQLIMIGPAYNLPTKDTKGSFGLVVNISVPLN
jgi:hypothetical protein